MAATRRVGTLTSKTRALLLDVTEQLMLDEGYAAVSSRSVAARAEVKAPLVHYYFPTLDDLFIAAFRRRSERNLERLANALQGDDPLQTLWDYANDRAHVVLTFEFLALANHRKAIQAEMGEVAERFRKVELEAFTSMAAASGIDLDEFPPDALLLIMMAIPTTVVYEEAIGMSTGHEHALMLVERYLSQFRGVPLRRPAPVRQAASSTKKPAKSTKKSAKSARPAKSTKKAAPPRGSRRSRRSPLPRSPRRRPPRGAGGRDIRYRLIEDPKARGGSCVAPRPSLNIRSALA